MVDKETFDLSETNTKSSTNTNTSSSAKREINKEEFSKFEIDPSVISYGSKLGQGGQGTVYEGIYNNKKVVIKTFLKEDYDEKEVIAYSRLHHELMVTFHGYYIDKNKSMNLVLDYADGENLGDAIPKNILNLNQKLSIIKKLVEFLLYLRENHAIHRDLKPQNIKVKIVNEDSIILKVLDFGITKITEETINYTRADIGTISYAPPEIFEIDTSDKMKISFKYDVWSLGLIISYLISGVYPWKKERNQSQKFHNLFVESQLLSKKSFIIPKSLDPKWAYLVELMTQNLSEDRINPATIQLILNKIESSVELADIKSLPINIENKK